MRTGTVADPVAELGAETRRVVQHARVEQPVASGEYRITYKGDADRGYKASVKYLDVKTKTLVSLGETSKVSDLTNCERLAHAIVERDRRRRATRVERTVVIR